MCPVAGSMRATFMLRDSVAQIEPSAAVKTPTGNEAGVGML